MRDDEQKVINVYTDKINYFPCENRGNGLCYNIRNAGFNVSLDSFGQCKARKKGKKRLLL